MTTLSLPQKRRLTGLLGLLAFVAIAGAITLNRSASADSTANPLLQPPTIENPAQSPFTGQTYDTLVALPGTTGTNGFLADFNTLLLGFAGAFAILAFFGGAYTFFLSGGNEDAMTKGRHQMLGSILAFVIIVTATAVTDIFAKLFAKGSL